ncbi:MAG: 50S ribosomal protein L1 [Planctomycetes bacterium]|nr:50S ribosomal protein L1 [Planctomycetota bacterium]
MAKKKEEETPKTLKPQEENPEELAKQAEIDEQAAITEQEDKKKQKRKRGKRIGHQNGKKIVEARKKVSEDDKFSMNDALDKLMNIAPKRKFDEAVEIAMKLGIDPKKQGQALRGALTLPHGVGKTNRVIAFAEGPIAEAALNAGAVEVGGDELAKKIKGGWDDFDVCIAHPSMMRVVGGLGKILGPKGKMPTPKNGTVTPNVEGAIKEFAAGKIEYRADEHGNVHAVMGKRSFDKQMLLDNIDFFVDHIKTVKPAEAKGTYIQKVYLSTSMGPSVSVLLAEGGK